MLLQLTDTLLSIFGSLGYFGITALMTVESCFLPFPSELVMMPAGYLAHQGELNIFLVVLAGTVGAVFGALINYYLAKYLGRMIVYNLVGTKLAKMLLISKRKVERSEAFFVKYGRISTFLGRLIPAVRQLISIPAGLAQMPIKSFIIWTFLGAMIWNIFLVVLGWQFGANQEKLGEYLHTSTIIGVILLIILVIYLIYKAKKRRRRKKLI
ncbi:MAG: DedA family protein [bacterium]